MSEARWLARSRSPLSYYNLRTVHRPPSTAQATPIRHSIIRDVLNLTRDSNGPHSPSAPYASNVLATLKIRIPQICGWPVWSCPRCAIRKPAHQARDKPERERANPGTVVTRISYLVYI